MKYPVIVRTGLILSVLVPSVGLAVSCTVDDDYAFSLGASGGTGTGATGTGGAAGATGATGGGLGEGGAGAGDGCESESKRCDGQQIEICAGSEWYPLGEPCEFACVAGTCVGACAPDSTQCLSTQVQQTCSGTGSWGPDEACDFACVEGSCGGDCAPGAFRCSDTDTPQRCDDAGEWQNQQADPCAEGCTDGLCDGPCVDDERRCVSVTDYEVCVDESWSGDPEPCLNQACVGTGCQGECSPGATRCDPSAPTIRVQTCNTVGEWGKAWECDGICVEGACVGECQPGASRCAKGVLEECDDSGKWQETACPAAAPVCATFGKASFCAECQPGVLGCDYQTLRECQPDGKWQYQRPCQKGEEVCHEGVCWPHKELCEGPSKATGCYDETTVWQCDGKGAYQEETCKDGLLCVDGECHK